MSSNSENVATPESANVDIDETDNPENVENQRTISIYQNGGTFLAQWLIELNKAKEAHHDSEEQTVDIAYSETGEYSFGDGRSFSWKYDNDTLQITTTNMTSIKIGDAYSPTDDTLFDSWVVQPSECYNIDTMTLDITDDSRSYSLIATYKDINSENNTLIANAQLLQNCIDEKGIENVDENTSILDASNGNNLFSLRASEVDVNSLSTLDLSIEGLEYVYEDGKYQTFTAPFDADYTIYAYGANGGTGKGIYDGTSINTYGLQWATNYIGRGGMTKATIHLKKGQTIHMYMGEAGGQWSTERTYGGGGGNVTPDKAWYPAGDAGNIERYHVFGRGGGATYVCVDNWTMDQAGQAEYDYTEAQQRQNDAAAEVAKQHVILLAAGGGGAGESGGNNNGGGLEGEGPYCYKYYGWFDNPASTWTLDALVWGRQLTHDEFLSAKVYPATQTRAGYGLHYTVLGQWTSEEQRKLYPEKEARNWGSFFYGSNGLSCSGSGGGGWFGGGADYAFSGGGGSSFINSSVTIDGESVEVKDGQTITGGNSKFDDTNKFACYINGRVIIRVNEQSVSLDVELQEAAKEEASASHPETVLGDKFGQTVVFQGANETSTDTVAYTALTYYQPADLMSVTTSWKYASYTNPNYQEWNDSVAKQINSNLSVKIVNENLGVPQEGDKYYNADYKGCAAIKSTMYISNVYYRMYDPENLVGYTFKCFAKGTYTLSTGTKTISAETDAYGSLTTDSNIELYHYGVNTYQKENIINGLDSTTIENIVTNTTDKTYSEWTYPQLTIDAPENTVLRTFNVKFDQAAYNAYDVISYDGELATNLNITRKLQYQNEPKC